MALSKDDLVKLGDLMDKKMDIRDGKLMGKMEGIINDKVLSKLGDMMDERMLRFHEQVTEPMINGVVEDIHDDISRLDKRVEAVENGTYRIERKLDSISDHHSAKIDEHEERIINLEKPERDGLPRFDPPAGGQNSQ